MGSPVIPVAHESEAAALLERIPPERRGSLVIGTPERVAEHLSTYIAAGFTGFTFGNTMLRTIESIGLAGEVLRLLA
jgi:alkanesulfonate monooxygenase SsuD/methylene tetrahydromethanopterin reductase-like flavin-dependent oxidoreductase (luciferase family)